MGGKVRDLQQNEKKGGGDQGCHVGEVDLRKWTVWMETGDERHREVIMGETRWDR